MENQKEPILVDEAGQVLADAALPAKADAQRTKPGLRLPRLRLPKITDPAQRRSGANILRFLALVLIFTLVARGTAGATLARVTVANPSRGEIVESVTGTATVLSGTGTPVDAPEGLTIKEMLATAGQRVEQGDPLAAYDPADVAEELARQQAALDKLNLELEELERTDPQDSTAMTTAQRGVARAKEDYNTAKNAGDSSVNAARALRDARQGERDAAAAEADAARAALDGMVPPGEDATGEELQAYQQAHQQAADRLAAAETTLTAAEAALSEAANALTEAEKAAAEALIPFQRAIEDAETSLTSQQIAESKNQQAAADTKKENRISAETKQLDIADKQKEVDALQALNENGGVLAAPGAGTVANPAAAGSPAAGGTLCTLAPSGGAAAAEMQLPKKDAEKLNPGDSCEVAIPGSGWYGGTVVNATITGKSAPDDSGLVTLSLRLPEGDWKNGQSLTVQAVQNRASYDTIVPLSAIHGDANSYYVYVLEERGTVLGLENVVVPVPVELLAKDGTNAAVSGMLDQNSKVVATAGKTLQNGDRVRVSA